MPAPTLTDRESFIAAIAAHPEEDTPRLAFADWLQEHGTEATDVAKAELIRVQCELEGMNITGKRTLELMDRQDALIAANEAAWRRGPVCEKCEGSGFETGRRAANGYYTQPRCPACHGTGDGGGLMRKLVYGTSDTEGYGELVRVHFDRGFLTRVTVPTLAELVATELLPEENGRKSRSIPSPLLRAIVGRVPGSPPERMLVREVVASDRKPFCPTPENCIWCNRAGNPRRDFSHWVDREIYDLLTDDVPCKESDRLWSKHYRTEAEAVSALARGICTWGRNSPA